MDSRRKFVIGMLVLLMLYVGPYFALSRIGFADAFEQGRDYFYFLPKTDTDAWRFIQTGCAKIYNPLIEAELWLGTGMKAAPDPYLSAA